MKRTIKAIVSCFVVAAMTAGMLWMLTGLTERKYGRTRLDAFLGETEDFDVLFLGSSHVIQGVYPMELWADYGIVSYNLGGHGSRIPTTYWTLVQALKKTTPKLVVIDGYYLNGDDKLGEQKSGHTHDALDPWPMSLEKLAAVFDLMPDKRNAVEYLWDFVTYHGRWSALTRNDFAPSCVEKGAYTYVNVAQPLYRPDPEDTQVMEAETVGVQYLRKMIRLCQKNGIDVLLTWIPGSGELTVRAPYANKTGAIAAEHGLNMVNFLTTEVIDYDTDCWDNGGHLNPSGARKVTDYLGQYIMANYDIPDRRDDPAYAGWHRDYEDYKAFKLDMLNATQIDYPYDSNKAVIDWKNYLMLLADRHLSYCVYLKDNNLWHGGSHYEKLLANIGIDSGALGADTLAVVDNLAQTVTYLAQGESTGTSFGTVAFDQAEDSFRVRIDGEAVLDVGAADAGAAVIDNAGGQVVTSALFAVSAAASINRTN